jgi:hypothetical protein
MPPFFFFFAFFFDFPSSRLANAFLRQIIFIAMPMPITLALPLLTQRHAVVASVVC